MRYAGTRTAEPPSTAGRPHGYEHDEMGILINVDGRCAESAVLERIEVLFLTADEVARSRRSPVSIVITHAVRHARTEHLPVDDVLRNWFAETLN